MVNSIECLAENRSRVEFAFGVERSGEHLVDLGPDQTCQLRRRPAKNDVALAHGNGGVLSSQCTVIFGSEATL